MSTFSDAGCESKRFFLLVAVFILGHILVEGKNATNSDTTKYHRNSIYSVLIEHSGYEFGRDIQREFLNIALPDKYNDHNLSERIFSSGEEKDQHAAITAFFEKKDIAKQLVSKWFNRSDKTGAFDMSLITERGFYDASMLDYAIAKRTARGIASLADAGEELIGRTFVIVNDIRYIDKKESAGKFSIALNYAGMLAGSVIPGASLLTSSITQGGMAISRMVAGFKVKITSYLYRLEWNDDNSARFYQDYYYDLSNIDRGKKSNYESDKTNFTLKLVGTYTAKSNKTVVRGLNSDTVVIRKVCARALDNNIAELQKRFDIFKIKTPILTVDEKYVTSSIGMKEGITSKSRFEVLEAYLDEGKTNYKRVGVIKPVKNKIWDNRYMSFEEKAVGADLAETTFEKVSGGDFFPGMLLREIK